MSMRRFVVFAAIVAFGAFARQVRAQSITRVKDEPSQAPTQVSQDDDPIRGSTLTFDQSMTTQTADIGATPQSYVPFYGWWFSLRPRWNFSEKLRIQARFDYYKELTNSQETSYLHEDVFGDIWTEAVYSTAMATGGRWSNTRLSLAARSLWPTSKQSQGQGTYLALGASAGVAQKIPIRGDSAPALNSAHVGLTFSYLHPFTAATTPTEYGNFSRAREPVDMSLPSFGDPQLTGLTVVSHTLYAILDTGLQVTPKLGLTLDMIWINQWHYPPTDNVSIISPTGTIKIPRSSSDQQYTQLTWLVVSADYDLFDELSIGLGYYNLANVIAPDGTVRGPFYGGQDNLFWSPDAHFFFDVTANLDRIFEDASGRYRWKSPRVGQTSNAAREARTKRIADE
jgi:hypothetical protein